MKNFLARLLKKSLEWRLLHIGDRQYILIVSAVVGFAVGLSTVILKNAVYLTESFLTFFFQKEYYHYLYFAYPIIGIFLVVIFTKFILKREIGHGISNVLYAISKKSSIIKRHYLYSYIVGSSITVGFGGSVGLEGPSVMTGSAIGSNLGRLLHLNYKQRTLLIGCASASAISAIFKAPIAGVIFVLEILMFDMTMAAILPLLISSVCAALTSYLIFGQQKIYTVHITDFFILSRVPFYIALGLLSGILSIYFTKTYNKIEKLFSLIKPWGLRLLVGGICLGILIFLFPPLYGEGYKTINLCLDINHYKDLLNNSLFYQNKDSVLFLILFLFLISLLKTVATSITFGSGGVGGTFAPTIFMGATFGLAFSTTINYFNIGGIHLPEINFVLAGMAGMIAGVSHAPLTAIFLIAEVTGGYELFMPLMITSTLSYTTIKYFMPNSIYTHQLARRKQLITHNKDQAVLILMNVENLIETNFSTIRPDATLGEFIKVIKDSIRNMFAVVDSNNKLVGVITMDNIRHVMFNQNLYNKVYVRDLMIVPEVSISPEDNMEDIAQKLQLTDIYNLPVLKDGKYLGFVSRANVFLAYRQMLKKHYGEE